MTWLQLYKFLNEYKVEYNYVDDDTIYLFITFDILDLFTKMLDDDLLDEDGIDCSIFKNYVAINISYILEYYDIYPENIFDKNKNYV